MKESFKKNIAPVIFIVIVLVLTAVSAYPQLKYSGKVVEVVDGKTCVIEMSNGKLTAILQYIEVPDPEQPLHQTVKDHLQKLILDKTVEFMPRNVMKTQTVGRLFVKGVDVSQQMLRDGAAWYAVEERESHEQTESLLYQNNETQAKAEKRGVWSDPNLKPVWEFRAENEAIRQKLAKDEWTRMVEKQRRVSGTQTRQPTVQMEMWADMSGVGEWGNSLGIGGLRESYNPSRNVGAVFTPSSQLDFPNSDFLRKVETRFFYGYRGTKTSVESDIYFMGFLTTSKNYKFLKLPVISIIADGQRIVLTQIGRYYLQESSQVKELLFGKIKRSELIKINKARKITVQLGKHSGVISSDTLMYLDNLLNVT